MLALNEGFRVPARYSPGGSEFEMLLLGDDNPKNGHIPSLRDAQRLKDAHACGLGRCAFTHDLAHCKLQRQPILALSSAALHRATRSARQVGFAGLLTAAEAQFQFDYAAVGSVVAQGSALHHLRHLKRAAKERRHFAPDARLKQIVERNRMPSAPPGPVQNIRFHAGLA
jgi:hypothetical protein